MFQIVGSFLTFPFHKVVKRRVWGVAGSIMTVSLYVCCWVRRWKNYENRSTFGEVTGKRGMPCFLTRGKCLICTHRTGWIDHPCQNTLSSILHPCSLCNIGRTWSFATHTHTHTRKQCLLRCGDDVGGGCDCCMAAMIKALLTPPSARHCHYIYPTTRGSWPRPPVPARGNDIPAANQYAPCDLCAMRRRPPVISGIIIRNRHRHCGSIQRLHTQWSLIRASTERSPSTDRDANRTLTRWKATAAGQSYRIGLLTCVQMYTDMCSFLQTVYTYSKRPNWNGHFGNNELICRK